jgi:putative phosphoribosyl transferase
LLEQNDEQVIEINREALKHLTNLQEKELVIVPRATHLFEEPGTLEKVSELAANWFIEYLFLTIGDLRLAPVI